MRLGKTIFAEAADLVEYLPGKGVTVASGRHPLKQLVFKLLQLATAFPTGHGAAQLIGFPATETGGDHGQLDHLLLKNGHPHSA